MVLRSLDLRTTDLESLILSQNLASGIHKKIMLGKALKLNIEIIIQNDATSVNLLNYLYSHVFWVKGESEKYVDLKPCKKGHQ